MNNQLMKNNIAILYLLPLVVLLFYVFWNSISFPLHDFANSYFSAHVLARSDNQEAILFDIYEFNKYTWSLGYEEVLVDFYLNSPFTTVAFYPFVNIQDAYLAKIIFNVIGSLLFVLAVYALLKRYGKNLSWFVVAIPFIFYVPIKNQILFGQSYFIIFALIVFSFLWLERSKIAYGVCALVLAIALKIFPLWYVIPLFFKKNWKAFLLVAIVGLTPLSISVLFTGSVLWETYFFEVIPNAIKNKSTVNFQHNAQSLDVFLKTIFVKDIYYNPDALFNNEYLYIRIKWVLKSIIIGIAISLSFSNKNNLLSLLSIWIVTVFLLQSRTATYAQILWIIPAFHVISSTKKYKKVIVFLIILFLVCNLPISKLKELPVLFQFSRLWLIIGLAIFFYYNFKIRIKYKYIGLCFILLLPLHLDIFSKMKSDTSIYVLGKQKYFMIFDFTKDGHTLAYEALGKKGRETIKTNINVTNFDEISCNIINNQIELNGKQITNDPSLKKKPILINNSEVYYLTDSRSRRGAFTIKKIKINNP